MDRERPSDAAAASLLASIHPRLSRPRAREPALPEAPNRLALMHRACFGIPACAYIPVVAPTGAIILGRSVSTASAIRPSSQLSLPAPTPALSKDGK